ncbi:MAG: DUF4336 domain-containing protein [Pseudomonadota bacterium]|nr:DUF4336 domain-containing protein [Pseudomonadota bacterium]
MLEEFAADIWLANGSEVTAAMGFHYPTRMVIVRLPNGALWVWSPVELTDGLRAGVEALGTVRYLVAPNHLHHVFIGDWARAFPEAEVWAAPGLAAKRGDLTITGTLDDVADGAWSEVIEQVVVTGNRLTTEVVFYHRPSRTVLVCDLLQQLPVGWFKGWRAIVARLDGMVGLEPGVPKKFRVAFKDKDAARTAVRRILAWPARAVVIAHGAPVTADGKAFLERAFAWLKPR